MKIRDIISALESVARPEWQEGYDNTGLQIGDPDSDCSGVLLCVDVTEEIVREAVARGCNLIVSHHPLMFRGVKTISGNNRVEKMIVECIVNGLNLYSCHTSIDNTPLSGVSWKIAERLGLENVAPLTCESFSEPSSGVIGDLPEGISALEFVERVKSVFHSPVARCSALHSEGKPICRVALCGGSGSDFIGPAIAKGADVYLTSDCKFNCFLDHADRIFLVDIGHFESEECVKDIFYQIITEKFPNFAVYKSDKEKNPINYL